MYIGKIFVGGYPPEIADWCNANNAHIEELEKVDDLRQFKIVENNATEPIEIQIKRLESYLSKTDWYCARYVDSGVPIPEEVQSKRQEAREEISALRRAGNEPRYFDLGD